MGYGINVRHLGLIRSHTTSDKYRDFLLAHIIARSMKNVMRADMREVMRTNKGSPTDVPLRDLVLNTYRKIRPFGHRVETEELRKESRAYWNNIFTVAMEQFIPRIRKPFTATIAASLLLANEAEQEHLAPSNAARLMEMSTTLMLHAHTSVPICPRINTLLSELFRKRAKLLTKPKDILVSKFTALRHMEMALPFPDHLESWPDIQKSFFA